MSDRELLKALNYCSRNKSCRRCKVNLPPDKCVSELMLLAIDLIERQKVEIVRLQKELALRDTSVSLIDGHTEH